MCAPDHGHHSMIKPAAKASSFTAGESSNPKNDPSRDLQKGVLYGTASLAFLFVATTVTMPHMQSQRDALGCDSMCLGSMTSLRSLLTLTGATLVGKMSDSSTFRSIGGARRICLLMGVLASAIGLLMSYYATHIQMLWASMIPGALLQHNADVLKALFSCYHDAVPERASSTDRAGSAGLLGMAVGIALMAGPLAGVSVFSTYQQATQFGLMCILISIGLVLMLPAPAMETPNNKQKKSGFFSSFDIPAARSPPALFLMTARMCMALAFHIFQTIWTASLKERFDFGPKDYGRFISFIGLTYALSQGFLAKWLLKFFGGHTPKGRVWLLLCCSICLGVGRFAAFQTSSLPIVYSLFAGIVTALGLVNTIFSADTSQIAPPDQIGGLFGVLAAVESAAGMAGPLLGGALSYVHPIKAPLSAVVALYIIIFLMVFFGYEHLVLNYSTGFSKKKEEEEEALMKRIN